MSRRHFNHREEHDPVGMLSNLFDVAMVFAVALMVALVTKFNMTEIFSKDDFTIVKNPGKENMEIITKEGEKINRYKPSDREGEVGKKGKKIGIAYELENGEIDLDESINKYMMAMKLVKECDEKLKNIEEQVNKMVLENGEVKDFELED